GGGRLARDEAAVEGDQAAVRPQGVAGQGQHSASLLVVEVVEDRVGHHNVEVARLARHRLGGRLAPELPPPAEPRPGRPDVSGVVVDPDVLDVRQVRHHVPGAAADVEDPVAGARADVLGDVEVT